ncbi:hypothetical protein SNE40_020684 [Patella caerulea]|uniref:Tetraspanin n=1 Tax=Patella caerulea TaxID=87958 RepID=A0AAN8J4V3_PATCE
MSNYGSKDNDGVTLAWDKLQQTLGCCGATTYEEWYSKPRTPLVPTSCCIDPKSTQCEHRRQTPIDNNFYTTGCVTALRNWVKEEAALVLGVCIGIGVIQIVGIILACCLGKAIRKQYKVL